MQILFKLLILLPDRQASSRGDSRPWALGEADRRSFLWRNTETEVCWLRHKRDYESDSIYTRLRQSRGKDFRVGGKFLLGLFSK